MIPELRTERLVVRLAQPGMQAAMARFLSENFEGHLDRWSPPVQPEFFTESFWADRLPAAVLLAPLAGTAPALAETESAEVLVASQDVRFL